MPLVRAFQRASEWPSLSSWLMSSCCQPSTWHSCYSMTCYPASYRAPTRSYFLSSMECHACLHSYCEQSRHFWVASNLAGDSKQCSVCHPARPPLRPVCFHVARRGLSLPVAGEKKAPCCRQCVATSRRRTLGPAVPQRAAHPRREFLHRSDRRAGKLHNYSVIDPK